MARSSRMVSFLTIIFFVFSQIMSEFNIFEVSIFINALYDSLNAEEWWDQEIRSVNILLALTKASHRRTIDLFTSCGLLVANLLPRHLYHLNIVSERETDTSLFQTVHHITYWNMRTYSTEQSRTHSHLVQSQLSEIEWGD